MARARARRRACGASWSWLLAAWPRFGAATRTRRAHPDATRARTVYSGATRWSDVWLSVQTECRRENQELEADLELAQEDKVAMGDELEALEARLRQHTRAGNS